MAYKFNDVAPYKYVNGETVSLSDAERQALADEWNANEAVTLSQVAEQTRLAGVEAAITTDSTIAQLKAMTAEEFDAWWSANVTTAAQAINVLKRVTRVVIRRML